MARVFISHSQGDQQLVDVLGGFFRSKGHSVSSDAGALAGVPWRETLERELQSADAVVVIWTNKSVGSDWVISEAKYALENKKLISLNTKDLKLPLPEPFDNMPTVPLDDRAAILSAVAAIAGAVDRSPDDVDRTPAHIEAAQPIHRLALWTTMAIGLMIVVAGVALVWLGATGNTELTLFGNTFKSETVGAVGIFCGAVIVILNVRRVLLGVERMGGPSSSHKRRR